MTFGKSSAIKTFPVKYTKFRFIRTSVNNWKIKCKTRGDSFVFKKAGRPNLLGGSLIKKVKDIAIGTRQVGGVINRRQIVSIAKGDVRANNPDILKEFRAKLVWRAAELNSSVLSDLN